MAVKDGLPSTDFSRMNREYIKAVAGEGGGTGLPAVTEADNGKILGVVNGAWGAMDAGGGGGGGFLDLLTATIALTYTFPDGAEGMTETATRTSWEYNVDDPDEMGKLIGNNIPDDANAIHIPYTSGNAAKLTEIIVTATDSEQGINQFRAELDTSSYSGNVEYSSDDYCALVSGDGQIAVVLQWMD